MCNTGLVRAPLPGSLRGPLGSHAHPVLLLERVMQKLRLVSHHLCPYVQRAAIVLHEKGAAFERTSIDLSNKPDSFLRLSPLGRVPLLVIEGEAREEVLFESAVIAEYLDETIAARLHPSDPLDRARHRAWIEFSSATLADIAGFYTGDQETYDAKRQALRAKFERLEATLGVGPYFAGEAFGLVDAAFAPVFRYFNLFDSAADHGVLAGLSKVSDWRRMLADRESVKNAVAPDYPNRLATFISEKNSHLASLLRG